MWFSLGKGEVESSILSRSTSNSAGFLRVLGSSPKQHSAGSPGTERAHDASIRGKSVDFVPVPFSPMEEKEVG